MNYVVYYVPSHHAAIHETTETNNESTVVTYYLRSYLLAFTQSLPKQHVHPCISIIYAMKVN